MPKAPAPGVPPGELALFFRTHPGGRLLITLFSPSTYCSGRPHANWLCFAQWLLVGRASPLAKLALFRTAAPEPQAGRDPLDAAALCSLDTCHFKPATPPELALFCTTGLRPGSKSGVTRLPVGGPPKLALFCVIGLCGAPGSLCTPTAKRRCLTDHGQPDRILYSFFNYDFSNSSLFIIQFSGWPSSAILTR